MLDWIHTLTLKNEKFVSHQYIVCECASCLTYVLAVREAADHSAHSFRDTHCDRTSVSWPPIPGSLLNMDCMNWAGFPLVGVVAVDEAVQRQLEAITLHARHFLLVKFFLHPKGVCYPGALTASASHPALEHPSPRCGCLYRTDNVSNSPIYSVCLLRFQIIVLKMGVISARAYSLLCVKWVSIVFFLN